MKQYVVQARAHELAPWRYVGMLSDPNEVMMAQNYARERGCTVKITTTPVKVTGMDEEVLANG